MTSVTAGKRSNIRWAKTDPIRVAVVPLPCCATAAAAPRPARTRRHARQHGVREQADRERREDEAERRVRLRIDCMIVVSHESVRVITDSRLNPIAAATQGQRTTVNASGRRASPARATRSARPRARAAAQPGGSSTSRRGRSRADLEVRLLEATRDVVPGVVLLSKQAGGAAHRDPALLVAQQPDHRLAERAGLARRTSTAVSGVATAA